MPGMQGCHRHCRPVPSVPAHQSPPSLHVSPRQSPAKPGSSTWPLVVPRLAPSCRDKWPPASAAALPQSPGTRAASSMATGPLGVTSIPPEPGCGCNWSVGGSGGHLTTCPVSLLQLPERFWLPVPGQAAVGGTSGNWPVGFAPLAKESDTPGVRLSPERCPSVCRAGGFVTLSRVAWMCKLVLLMWGLLVERVDLLPRHVVKYLGIRTRVQGESPRPAEMWGAAVPLFWG